MKNKTTVIDFIMAFFVITTCITILQAVIGLLFLPGLRFGFEAFLSPPIFGALSSASGLVTKSKNELSMGQMAFRQLLQLFLIEGMVFGINYFFGNKEYFTWSLNVPLFFGIAFVYVLVYFIMWLNDRRNAMLINERLKILQNQENG